MQQQSFFLSRNVPAVGDVSNSIRANLGPGQPPPAPSPRALRARSRLRPPGLHGQPDEDPPPAPRRSCSTPDAGAGSPRRSLTPRRRPAGRATAHRRPYVTPRSRRRSHSAPPAGLDSARAALERSLALPHPAAAAAAACVSVDSADDGEEITLAEPLAPALPPDPVLAPLDADAAAPDAEDSADSTAAARLLAAADASEHSVEPSAEPAPTSRDAGRADCRPSAAAEALHPAESDRAGGGAVPVRRMSSAEDLRGSAHEQRQRSGAPPTPGTPALGVRRSWRTMHCGLSGLHGTCALLFDGPMCALRAVAFCIQAAGTRQPFAEMLCSVSVWVLIVECR